MRAQSSHLLSLIFTIPLPLANALIQPFFPAATAPAAALLLHPAPPIVLDRRQSASGCISGTFSCANLGSLFTNICCATGQLCTLDSANQPACCPSGDVCTGTAPATFAPPTGTATATAATSVSFVANSYFSFPYIATSFSNSAACASAVSECSANYGLCTSELGGGVVTAANGYGVTIVVPGGTTVVGTATTTVGAASATSVCSSLSSVACFGLQSSVCSQTGTANGFVVGSASPARPTAMPCVGVAGVVAAGVGIGVMANLV